MPRLNPSEYPSLMQFTGRRFQTILADAVRDVGVPVRLGVTVNALRADPDGQLEVPAQSRIVGLV